MLIHILDMRGGKPAVVTGAASAEAVHDAVLKGGGLPDLGAGVEVDVLHCLSFGEVFVVLGDGIEGAAAEPVYEGFEVGGVFVCEEVAADAPTAVNVEFVLEVLRGGEEEVAVDIEFLSLGTGVDFDEAAVH